MRALAIGGLTALLAVSAVAGELRIEQGTDSVRVLRGDTLLTQYKTGPEQKYPYFYPVNGPTSGESVTTESSRPFPHHQSLFFGCDFVNGGNFWQDSNARGQIVSQGTAVEVEQSDVVRFRDTCLWQIPGEEPIIRDERVFVVRELGEDAWALDVDIRLHALTDIHIRKTNHSLFSARMRPELSVESGGTMVNAEGALNAEGTHGEPSAWCDASGTRDGITEGLAIFDHTGNPWHPSPWFTRDYGFLSPTPLYWFEEGYGIPQGEVLHLRYRVVVHAGDAEEARIAERYAEWAAETNGE